jgi:hypothetical protein
LNDRQQPEQNGGNVAILAFVTGGVLLAIVFVLFLAFRPSEEASVEEERAVPSEPVHTSTSVPSNSINLGDCYNVSSPRDRLEVISIEPPLNTNPTNDLRVTLRYNLESHDTAMVSLLSGTVATGRTGISPEIEVTRGSGVVTVEQRTRFTGATYRGFTVHLSPKTETYRQAGYRCFRPLVILELK